MIAKTGKKRNKKEGPGVNTFPWCQDFLCLWVVWGAASYSNHLPARLVQAVEALACVNKIMTLDEELFFLEPVQCVPHRPGGKGGLADEIFLCQLFPVFEHFVHELCRWRQVPDLSDNAILVCIYNKNDPSSWITIIPYEFTIVKYFASPDPEGK